MASTTSVLPAPVSPVTAVMPGPSTSDSSRDHAEVGQTASSLSTVVASVTGRSGGTWP